MTTISSSTTALDSDASDTWRHNARTLAVAQALGGASPSIVVALGGLVGQGLAPTKALATVPVSLLQLGLALGTIPAALLMARLGRRNGYLIGCLIGIASGCIAAAGIASGSFLLFCAGTCLAGFYSSYVNSYRFAAVDHAPPAFRAKAISWVMTGGIAAGIIGPQTVIWTRDAIPSAPFAGGFLGQSALALLSILVIARLRTVQPPPAAGPVRQGRPLREILAQRRLVLAILAGLVSYGLMSLLMTSAPVAMVVECGLPIDQATLSIQWHILAMFGPSLVTGKLIGRFGKMPVTVTGLLLIGAAAVVALTGRDTAHFWLSLILVGLGWNFGFIGATATVTDCYHPEERAKVQGLNDFLVFGTVAIASFSSGGLLSAGGWNAVAWLALPVVAIALGLLALPRLLGWRMEAATG